MKKARFPDLGTTFDCIPLLEPEHYTCERLDEQSLAQNIKTSNNFNRASRWVKGFAIGGIALSASASIRDLTTTEKSPIVIVSHFTTKLLLSAFIFHTGKSLKRNAQDIDETVVYFSNDETMAKFKTTVPSLIRKGYMEIHENVHEDGPDPTYLKSTYSNDFNKPFKIF